MSKLFYITTTLPYVNAEPHIGFAMEIIRADAIARAHKLAGYNVFFNTGTDEHGLKIYRKAKEQGIDTQEYVDGLATKYKELLPVLGIMPEINFIRTSDAHHKQAATEFWKRVDKNGYIYKKAYSIKYCVGCELEKTESELVDDRCPLHPLQQLEIINEENYFFKFSAFKEKLLALYESNPTFVIPDFRFNEIKAFVSRGLEDFSISRLASKMPWGVPVPGDPDQVMYVWFDALVSYISTLGWPEDEDKFKKYWSGGSKEEGDIVQYCGKDNLRQQSAMWQAMLMAADLPPTKTIVINGFITGDGGIKMSKSLGNTVDPLEIIKEYGTDALRYFLLTEINPFEDSPFTMDRFKDSYNAILANGLGNLTSRILKMATDNLDKPITREEFEITLGEIDQNTIEKQLNSAIDTYNLRFCLQIILGNLISSADNMIQNEQPFKLVKENKEKGIQSIRKLVQQLGYIAIKLQPFLPETAQTIQNLILENKMPEKPLFMRK